MKITWLRLGLGRLFWKIYLTTTSVKQGRGPGSANVSVDLVGKGRGFCRKRQLNGTNSPTIDRNERYQIWKKWGRKGGSMIKTRVRWLVEKFKAGVFPPVRENWWNLANFAQIKSQPVNFYRHSLLVGIHLLSTYLAQLHYQVYLKYFLSQTGHWNVSLPEGCFIFLWRSKLFLWKYAFPHTSQTCSLSLKNVSIYKLMKPVKDKFHGS